MRYHLEAWYNYKMEKRGAKPQGKVKIKWSPEFTYALGLLATDGNLSPDGRHITFTSKDLELVRLFNKCLGIKTHIGRKSSGSEGDKKYFVIQFGDVLFYNFLISIGITPRKSLTLGSVNVPQKYFRDFVRGCLDGDGSFYSYWDPRWRSSFMFYTEFISASKTHILWLQRRIKQLLDISGHITTSRKKNSWYQLKYAKKESLKLFQVLYYNKDVVCLSRKRIKIEKAFRVDKNARVAKLVDVAA